MAILVQKQASLFLGGLFIGPSANVNQLVATVPLTPAQLAAMYATPVSILPAPPSNFVNIIDSIYVQFKYGSAVFTGGGAIKFQYHGTSVVPHTGTIAATMLTTAANDFQYLPPAVSGAVDLQSAIALGLDITNASAAFAGGTGGSLIVTVSYAQVELS